MDGGSDRGAGKRRAPRSGTPSVNARHALRLADVLEKKESALCGTERSDGAEREPQSRPVSEGAQRKGTVGVGRRASDRGRRADVGYNSKPAAPIPSDTAEDLSDAARPPAEITQITPPEEGEMISVTLVTRGEDGKKLRRHIRLLTEQYADLRPAVGEISSADAEKLADAGMLCDAIRKGMELLGYGAMSRRRLTDKLTVRGFSREMAASAAEYLEVHGFLPEADDAVRFAEQGARKLWGPRRIRDDLFARGFPSEVIAVAMDSLADVDFAENCARVIEKKYGGVPKDPAAKRKMIAALMRLGYTSDHIRDAIN